ncbi:PEP-CTERM sorting domain-containing protein [bacterium]|nr:PEP-CTERM sorting domain-containing protein [Akkermansiaceae bacterium]MDB4288919.1 PEP-CTERM sorting domain-containing protein [bacterium]MDB4326081.1 PEP-CTERM sorting domain-containing protein [Akkermansiaceae bacterium]MDB4382441.1 PEP-CTERM sorting domain-containing protein [Akkermansiaceae bacterium]MDB4597576.1 PEP-CTERM sorting domain-containing protein [Akkermansiaceae bacterium]
MKLRKSSTILALAASSALTVSSQGALISWAPSVDLIAGGDNDSFVSTNGTPLVAFNGGDNPASTVLNGTTFVGIDAPTYNTTGITGGGVTVTGTNNANNDTGPGTYGGGEFTDAGTIPVINSGLFDMFTLSMSGLTIGNSYEMQLIVNDARGGGPGGGRDQDWQVGVSDGSTNATIAGIADLTNSPTATPGLPLTGDFIIGTFTADATTQSFLIAGTRSGFTLGQAFASPNNGQGQINGFQLRETAVVPEPSSALLLGLAGFGFLVRRRK